MKLERIQGTAREVERFRAEVRLAGDTSGSIRLGVWMVVALLLYVPCMILVGIDLYVGPPHGEPGLIPSVSLAIVVVVAAVAGLAACVACPIAAGYRSYQRRRLGATIRSLDRERRWELLEPLLEDRRPDTRRIVASLLRERRNNGPTEVIPASQPGGAGSELAPPA